MSNTDPAAWQQPAPFTPAPAPAPAYAPPPPETPPAEPAPVEPAAGALVAYDVDGVTHYGIAAGAGQVVPLGSVTVHPDQGHVLP